MNNYFHKHRRWIAILVLAMSVALLPLLTARAEVTNGGFETGTFAGWTVVNWAEGSGNWYIQTGPTSPVNGSAVPAPPEGNFAAMTDQSGVGSHVLYQDISVPPQGGTLSFYLYYSSQEPIVAPATLDPFGGPNQQYRVDLLNPAEPVFSLNVLETLFATVAGDPQVLGPTVISADLTPYGGSTVRLRAAEVDTLDFFNAAIDGVVFVPNPIDDGGGGKPPAEAVIVVAVPGCDALISIPSTAVGAKITADTLAMWKPGQTTTTLLPAGTSVRALGVDASGQYTQILFACNFLWVPSSAIGPNPEAPWHGAPLPKHVVPAEQ